MAKIPSSAFYGFDLRKFGGVPVAKVGAKLKDVLNDPEAATWNFGIAGAPGLEGPPPVMSSAPAFYDVAPKMQGVWDGKTTYNPHALARKVLGKDIPAQMQPRGTCFPEDTLILMGDGTQKSIQDVEVGDVVITHAGTSRKVVRTMQRPYTGEMYHLHIAGMSKPITMTDEHPVYITKNSATYKGSGFMPGNCGWVEAKNILKNDRVLVPYGPDLDRTHTYDLAKYITRFGERQGTTGIGTQVTHTHVRTFQGKDRVNRFVPLDSNLGRLLGLFIAEGSTDTSDDRSGGKTVFTYCIDEEMYANETKELVRSLFGVECNIVQKPENNTIKVSCYSGIVTKFFRMLCGENSYSKRIPDEVFSSSRLVRIAVMRGWIDGDGDLKRNEGNKLQIRGVTSSARLANGMRRLALSCRMHASVITRKKQAHQRVASNDVYITGEDVLKINPDAFDGASGDGRGRMALRTAKGFLCPVKRIESEHVEDVTVYNLEVEEEHTYIANGIAVHNCGGRTGKMSGQLLQGVMIATGMQNATYKPVSHAWLYALARREYGMLGSGDGVPDGSIPPVMAKYGLLNAEEAGDTNDYGNGSDDLAAKWGGRSGPPEKFFEVAADNKVEGTLVRVRSIQEYADACSAGGVGLVSSMRGFTMQRDSNGVCRPSGTWAHYMATSGITLVNNGVIIPIVQSWGRNTPGGPTLKGSGNDGGWPDYVFGATADVFERDMIKRGSVHVIFAYPAWDIKPKKLDWSRAA